MLGYPSISDFKEIINTNLIQNCPVTVEDINISIDIFGPDIFALKGKTTCKKTLPVVSDIVKVPSKVLHKHKNVTISADFMFMNVVENGHYHEAKQLSIDGYEG